MLFLAFLLRTDCQKSDAFCERKDITIEFRSVKSVRGLLGHPLTLPKLRISFFRFSICGRSNTHTFRSISGKNPIHFIKTFVTIGYPTFHISYLMVHCGNFLHKYSRMNELFLPVRIFSKTSVKIDGLFLLTVSVFDEISVKLNKSFLKDFGNTGRGSQYLSLKHGQNNPSYARFSARPLHLYEKSSPNKFIVH